MQGLCQKAKDKGVIIYAIAVEAGSHGAQEIAKCASSTSHYFNVNGGELEQVFGAIARQITDLRPHYDLEPITHILKISTLLRVRRWKLDD